MKLLSLILLAAFESLFANFASSQCQPLNRTLFNGCLNAGYNVSEFSRSRPQDEVASLISNMQSKFENCSASLSTLMTCSIHVPKCSTSSPRLPCKKVCRKFVRDCQDGSSDGEGLLALFRGLCELIPPATDQCLPSSQQFNSTRTIDITCHRLDISQCANAGYSLTSVSSAYQKKVESSNIFQGSDMNSTLRKIICMEVAPPCDNKNNHTLLVPCKSTCEAAFKESKSQFLEVFRSPYYCSAFPMNESEDGKAYCRPQAWPDAGYWPSNLWRSIGQSFAAEQSTSVSTTVPTTKQSKNVSSLVPTNKTTENVTTTVPTTKESGHGSTPGPTSKPSGNGSTSVPTSTTSEKGSTPVPTSKTSGNSTTPVPTSQTSENGTTPVPTSKTSEKGSTPVSTTKTPGNRTTPVPTSKTSENGTTPVPTSKTSENGTTPMPTSKTSENGTTPVPTSETSENGTTPVPTSKTSENGTTPVPTSKTSENGTTPVPTSTTSENGTTPVPTSKTSENGSTPVPTSKTSENGTTPVPTSKTSGNESSPAPPSKTARKSSSPAPPTKTSEQSSSPGSPTKTTKKSTTDSGSKGSPNVRANKGGGLSAGTISGIVLGVIAIVVAIVVGIVFFRRYKRRKNQYSHSLMVNMDEL